MCIRQNHPERQGGARGVELNWKRKVRKKDIKNLVFNGKTGIIKEISAAFLKAHNGVIRELFKEPAKDNELFNFPFFMTDEKGSLNKDEDLGKQFNKALIAIPGKARFDGFHLAVLGRFDKAWRDTALNIVKLVFVTRYMPREFKKIARIPIPKPNTPNEYRPISLCHDLYCFVNSIIAELTSKALEEAGIIPEGLAAYIKGRGCPMLVATELSLREDCIESNIPTWRLDEDEEKFFDRICLELILTVLRINGFPVKGYVELKASCMWDKEVEIITNRGSVFSEFKCGLEQGNPDSPKMANLVIMLKHLLWNNLTKKLKNEYKMFSIDICDGITKISGTGFSDDNTQNSANQCVDKLIEDLKQYIKLSGDLSMVLKIGRKGSKCIIYLYNIPAGKILDLPEFETIAWSFKDDCPTKEIIPAKIYLQKEEINKLQKLLKTPELKEKVEKLINKKDNKHLGLYMDLEADTAESCKKTLEGVKERIKNIKLYNLNVIPLKITTNMLITTMHSFAPLQKNYKIEDLIQYDQLLMNSIRTACGYSKNDAKHLLFLSEKVGGFGIKSFQECDLKAIARELEVILNGSEYDGKSLRSRVAAIKNRISEYLGTRNHVRDAIIKIAKYGIYLRDRKDGLINRILDNIAIKLERMPIGDPDFASNEEVLLGPGVLNLTQTALGSTWHFTIKNLILGIWSEEQARYMVGKEGLDLINNCLELAIDQEKSDQLAMTTVFEWSISKNHYKDNDPMEFQNWEELKIDDSTIDDVIRNINNKWSFDEIWKIGKARIQINPLECINWNRTLPCSKNNLGEALIKIAESKSPILIATDGGHVEEANCENLTSAAITICTLDIKQNETLESGEWMHRKTIPMIMRSCILPNLIGANPSDCNHGEAMAICLQEECLPKEISRAVIMDSESVRSRFLELRQKDKMRDRVKIRCTYPGIGKGIMSRLHGHVRKWKSTEDIIELIPKNAPNKYKRFCMDLKDRHNNFVHLMNKNTEIDEEVKNLWKSSSRDNHTFKSVWKVDSHQLNEKGDGIKKTSPRHPTLVPNLALLNANHWADTGASSIMKWMNKGSLQNMKTTDIYYTSNELRFFFTWKGRMIDKNTCLFLGKQLEMERLKRWQSKEAHGMLGRMLPVSSLLPRDIPYKSSYRRFLIYLTNTHTRSMYKCIDYKNAATLFITNKLMSNEDSNILDTEYLETFSVEDQLLCRCTWCEAQWKDFNYREDCELKGNRRHVLLFCENERIQSFRRFMNRLIEDALVELHKLIINEVEVMNGNIWLFKIQDTLLHLQEKGIGRMTKRKNQNNPLNYVQIKHWLQKLNVHSIEEGINKKNRHYLPHCRITT